jgi:PIN domain nuclease of toxin-antitoxin system
LLAFLNGESGADVVEPLLPSARISSVNLAEVLTRLVDRDVSDPEASWNRISGIVPEVTDFDLDLARRTAELRPATRRVGLSPGDRACLALAARTGLPALAADRHGSISTLGSKSG